jgi:pimeloyl-ACP methyl ester carboxylesterase
LGGIFYIKENIIMDSKFIIINGLTIHYVEKNEQEKNILVFIHGNSGSTQNWYKQINDKLFNNFRLIALDLPGHGKSFRSPDPHSDYSPIGTAEILSKAIIELAASNPFILVGFSYGTNVVAETLNHNVKPKGIILAGSCIIGRNYGLEKVFVQNETPSIFFYNETDERVIENYIIEALSNPTEIDIEILKKGYLDVSPEFKPALFNTVKEGKFSDEVLALSQFNLPVCVIFGNQDKLVQINYLDDLPFPIWKKQIYKFPNVGHWLNMDEPDSFNQIVFEYAEECIKPVHA